MSTKTPAKRKAKSPAKRAATPRKRAPKATPVTPEERWRLIAEAAYLRAERRGFQGGSAEHDWLEAEAEVDRALAKKKARRKKENGV